MIESGEEGMLGYFIGQDSEHVSVVATYCERCHGDKNSLERSPKIRPVLRNRCYCDNDIFLNQADLGENKATSECGKRIKLLSQGNLKSIDSEDLEEEFSIYICEPQVLEKTIIIDETSIVTDKLKPDVKDHVVLCIFADETSPLLGLHNFLLPLRSKYISKDTLKPVVIVSNRRFIEREWPLIRKIPGIYVITGSPLCLQNLEQANINECSVCIVLSMLARTEGHEIAINDKESVLCSLSIQEHLKKTARHNILIITDLSKSPMSNSLILVMKMSQMKEYTNPNHLPVGKHSLSLCLILLQAQPSTVLALYILLRTLFILRTQEPIVKSSLYP